MGRPDDRWREDGERFERKHGFLCVIGLLRDVQNSFGNLLNLDTREWMKEEALLAACGFISTGVSNSVDRNVTTWRIVVLKLALPKSVCGLAGGG